MKLRNKKTGEVLYMYSEAVNRGGEPEIILFPRGQIYDENKVYHYKTLAELTAEWEDMPEEEKITFLINEGGSIDSITNIEDEELAELSAIGNYFETEEEAEKVVEKLKALKRLKNKGLEFSGYDVANRGGDNVICGQVYFKAGNYDREEIKSDLDICFGGEE